MDENNKDSMFNITGMKVEYYDSREGLYKKAIEIGIIINGNHTITLPPMSREEVKRLKRTISGFLRETKKK